MNKEFVHAGHTVHVWTSRESSGRFRWHASIDGEHLATSPNPAVLYEDFALEEGTVTALTALDVRCRPPS